MIRILIIILFLAINFVSISQNKILFDNTKSEQAGNADWVIDSDSRYPSPAQSGITGSGFPNPTGDVDDYWSGALSMWGIEMVKQGFGVETLPRSGRITFNDASNNQDLSNYNVFVVCEPNNPFLEDEKKAMMNFISNGGGLFIISNHTGADRDNDGWDALEVWNDFILNNPVKNNAFGFVFDEGSKISAVPTKNIPYIPNDPLLHGRAGDVDGMESHVGATISINPQNNASVKAIVFRNGVSNTGETGALVVYAKYGSGKVVGLSDSSCAEDITPNGGRTYDGWIQPERFGDDLSMDNGRLITNASIWLADNVILPEPTNNVTNFKVSNIFENTVTLTWDDATGGQLPNGYLVKAVINPEIIIDPIDSVQEYDSKLAKNVYPGAESLTFTGLQHSTIYDFKIYSFTNSEENINYLVPSDQTAQAVTLEGADTISYDDFSDCSNSSWFAFSVEGKTDKWKCKSAGYRDINGYGDEADEDWLIHSTIIDFDNYTEGSISFRSQERYTGPDLEIYYSSNYSGFGTPAGSEWTLLPYTFNDGSTGSSFSTWEDNRVDLSDLSGKVFLAFKYVATGEADFSEHWRLDDIKITGFPVIPAPEVMISFISGCNDSGTVTVSSNQSGDQTFYLRDSVGNAITEWTGDVTSHDFTGLANGKYKGQVKNGNKISTLSSEVVLVNLEDPVVPTSISASKLSICKGESVTLSFVGGEGDEFTWYKDFCLGEVVGIGELTITPIKTTTYFGSWSNECNTSECLSLTIEVSEQIISIAGDDVEVCDSVYQLLGNNPSPGNGIWTIKSGEAAIENPSQFDSKVTVITSPVVLNWSVTNGACFSEDNMSISLKEKTSIITQPNETNNVKVNDPVTFSVKAKGESLTYQWFFNDVEISDATSAEYYIASVSASNVGDYKVIVTGVCGQVVSEIAKLSVITAVNDLDKWEIDIFPNPTSGLIYVESKDNFKLTVYDIFGKVIKQMHTNTTSSTIDISNYSNGLFFIKFENGKSNKIVKIVKVD